jgi:hypothetical protein
MSASPSFVGTPRVAMAQISTANTNRDGTGTIGDVLAAGANGTRVDRVTMIATGTTAAGMIRLFIYDGTNTRLWKEVSTAAATPSGTVQADSHVLSGLGLIIPNNYHLKASTNNAETWNVIAECGDF